MSDSLSTLLAAEKHLRETSHPGIPAGMAAAISDVLFEAATNYTVLSSGIGNPDADELLAACIKLAKTHLGRGA